MKSITTCPSCQTQFLVTDEQLSQYNGKVRCGHCLNVFNAIDYISVQPAEVLTEQILVKDTVPPEEQDNLPQINSDEQTASIHNTEAISSIAELLSRENIKQAEVTSETMGFQTDSPEAVSTSEPEIKISNANSAETSSDIKSADVLKELFSQAELPLEEIIEKRLDLKDTSASLETTPIQTELSSEAYEEEVSKINDFDYKPEYQYFLEEKKSTSPVLVTLGGLFILLALFQGTYFYRHKIAMHYPVTKPYLVSMCQIIGCKINLPQEIQLFSIDDSTITEDTDHQGVIRLSSTITNRAGFNQAYPNLEVTLTDTQDKPKLRRIFKPNEYLTKAYRLDEGITSGDSIEIDMPLMADDFKPAGFRLLVSY